MRNRHIQSQAKFLPSGPHHQALRRRCPMSTRPGGGQGGGRAEAEVPTATKEDLELVRTVCQIVARQFYQDQHAILIDVLSTHLV